MHKPESVFENEIYKILLDFEIQRDNLIPGWSPDPKIINKKEKWKKKKNQKRELAASWTLLSHCTTERKSKNAIDEKVFGSCQRTKIAVKNVDGGDTIYNWHAWNGP